MTSVISAPMEMNALDSLFNKDMSFDPILDAIQTNAEPTGSAARSRSERAEFDLI